MCQSCRGGWRGEGFKLGETVLWAGGAVEQQSGGIHRGSKRALGRSAMLWGMESGGTRRLACRKTAGRYSISQL